MYIIDADIEDVYKEFPFINDWTSTICKNILNKIFINIFESFFFKIIPNHLYMYL